MTNPVWLNDFFAAVMLAVALYSAGRLVVARVWSRPTHRDVDVAHVLMGTAMAGMLVSDLNPIPNGLWEVVFSSLAAWFVWRCYQFVRDPSTGIEYHQHVHRLSRRTDPPRDVVGDALHVSGRRSSISGRGRQHGDGGSYRRHFALRALAPALHRVALRFGNMGARSARTHVAGLRPSGSNGPSVRFSRWRLLDRSGEFGPHS